MNEFGLEGFAPPPDYSSIATAVGVSLR
jgi:hypothetical protein